MRWRERSTVDVDRFKKLMLNRIDWNKTKEDETEEEVKNKKHNQCDLVWEGTILKANFQNFKFETPAGEAGVRKYLSGRWSEHYWDMCKNFKLEE